LNRSRLATVVCVPLTSDLRRSGRSLDAGAQTGPAPALRSGGAPEGRVNVNRKLHIPDN